MKSIKILGLIGFVLFIFTNCQSKNVEATQLEQKPEPTITPNKTEQTKTETPEEKAVRLAEEFIKRNGYTDAPADKNNLSHETVEYHSNVEELLKLRQNTLEPKAYGVFYRGRLGDEKGWTIVFRHSEKVLKEFEKLPKSNLVGNPKLGGRAVTMNGKFENLLLEHKDFFLDKVDKRF